MSANAAERFAGLIDPRTRPQAWYALGLTRNQRQILALAGAIGCEGILIEMGQLGPMHGLAALLLLATAIVSYFLPDRLARWYRTRCIDGLELPIDRASYADALDGTAKIARLRMIVDGKGLAIPPPTGIVADVIEASSTRLVIDSFTMSLDAGFQVYPAHNLEMHRWFVLACERILRPLARDHAITRISFEHRPMSRYSTTRSRPPR